MKRIELFSEHVAQGVCKHLLGIKAIKLQPDNPFTWASGWQSPIYCNNRALLSHTQEREITKFQLTSLVTKVIQTQVTNRENLVLAGVATGAIAIGAIIADRLNLPFVYVRSAPKGHGLENLIEGDLEPGSEVIVIEDLLSTGGSSKKAADAITKAGGIVKGMVAIFSYQFDVAHKLFSKEDYPVMVLADYPTLLSISEFTDEQFAYLRKWREDPANWVPV